MQAVILDAGERESLVWQAAKTVLEEKKMHFQRLYLPDMNILPCRSCGSCALKTPGRCQVNDDMPSVMFALAPAQLLVMLTPVTFGGYSSQLKKAVDKLMLMGLPLYTVKNGSLVHPMRYGEKFLLGIGMASTDSAESEESFRVLLSRNAINMQFPYSALVFKPSDTRAEMQDEIRSALEGVDL